MPRLPDAGWSSYYASVSDQNPNLGLLHEDPESVAMIDELILRIADQLAEIRALVLAGELAGAPEQLVDSLL